MTEDGKLIAGEGRYKAAQLLGLAKVPVIVLAGLSPARRRALAVADNKIAENAGWNRERLVVLNLDRAAHKSRRRLADRTRRTPRGVFVCSQIKVLLSQLLAYTIEARKQRPCRYAHHPQLGHYLRAAGATGASYNSQSHTLLRCVQVLLFTSAIMSYWRPQLREMKMLWDAQARRGRG